MHSCSPGQGSENGTRLLMPPFVYPLAAPVPPHYGAPVTTMTLGEKVRAARQPSLAARVHSGQMRRERDEALTEMARFMEGLAVLLRDLDQHL